MITQDIQHQFNSQQLTRNIAYLDRYAFKIVIVDGTCVQVSYNEHSISGLAVDENSSTQYNIDSQ